MKLCSSVQDVITKKLDLTVDEICTMGAEKLDEYIATKIVKRPLVVTRVHDELVPGRGSVLRTISRERIDAKIDSMLSA